MSKVKDLLKKIINEEIDKLEEQRRVTDQENMRSALTSPEAFARYLVSQNRSRFVNRTEGDYVRRGAAKYLQASQNDPAIAQRFMAAYEKASGGEPLAFRASFAGFGKVSVPKINRALRGLKQIAAKGSGSGKGIPKTKEGCPVGHAKDNTGKCVPVKSEFRPPEDGQPDDGQKAPLAASRPPAKGKGASAGKGVAKRKPRGKSMDVMELQSLLKQRFKNKINLGKTGKNKDGVDGAYGTLTQRAIDLLRKTDKNAPKRQGSFKKSVRALVDYLKGAGKGSGAGAAKGISGKKYSAAEIGSVLKNMNLVVSPDDPKAKDLINKLMRAQAKGTQLSLRTIKMAGDTALGLKEIYQYAEDEDCEEWSVIIDEARELLERGEISKKVFKELKKSVPKGCGHH